MRSQMQEKLLSQTLALEEVEQALTTCQEEYRSRSPSMLFSRQAAVSSISKLECCSWMFLGGRRCGVLKED